MHQLHVGTEQAGLVELPDRAGARRVQGDRQSKCPRPAPVLLRHVDRERSAHRRPADVHGTDVARADAKGEEAVTWHPVALHASQAGEVHRLIVWHALRRAVGEAPADAGVAHGGELGVGVIRAPDVVRPVVHRRHAGAQGFGNAEPHAAVAVLGREELAEAAGHREIAELARVRPDERAGTGSSTGASACPRSPACRSCRGLRSLAHSPRRREVRPPRWRRRAHARRLGRNPQGRGPWSARWHRG